VTGSLEPKGRVEPGQHSENNKGDGLKCLLVCHAQGPCFLFNPQHHKGKKKKKKTNFIILMLINFYLIILQAELCFDWFIKVTSKAGFYSKIALFKNPVALSALHDKN
jgi:hypothetical protein